MPKNTATVQGSQDTFEFVENLTDFLFGLSLVHWEQAINAIYFLPRLIFVMLLTLLIHIQFIAAPMIFVSIGFFLAIIFIASGVIAAMKTEIYLDFMFHKNQDEKD